MEERDSVCEYGGEAGGSEEENACKVIVRGLSSESKLFGCTRAPSTDSFHVHVLDVGLP
jgi:hypothetical protein